MTKQVFMQKLGDAIARLKPEERKEILADFEEHFANGIAGGKTEEEVARDLGDPESLAAQYTEGLPEPKPPVKASGVAAGALASIALLLFDAIIAIPVIATLFSIWISLWAVALAFFCSAFACIVAPFTALLQFPSVLAGAGMCMIGISLLALSALAGIGMAYATKWSYKGLAGYVKAHIRIIKGGTRA
jgi:uncharacterized membrane protein